MIARKTQSKTRAKSRSATLTNEPADTLRAVERFLYSQAELLDAKSWQKFIELFAADGIYWAPAHPDHTSWDGVPSIFCEDRDMMTIRMKRMQHPHAWSQKTAWGTNHVIGNVVIDREDPKTDDIVVRSRFHMMEYRRDVLRHFGGSYVHHLKSTKNGYRIKLQRVDMVNGDGPYEYVLQAWV